MYNTFPMLRSRALLLYKRAGVYQRCRTFSARSRPSAQPEVPPQDPTPNPEESAIRTAESATETNADKQVAGTKGRKTARKAKKQFAPVIPGKIKAP